MFWVRLPGLVPRRFLPLLLPLSHHDFVLLAGGDHAQKEHHSRHETAPSRSKPEVFRSFHHLIHGHQWTFHEGVLWEARHRVRIFADVRFRHLHTRHPLVLRLSFLFQWGIGHRLFRRGTYAHAASQTWAVLV